MYQKYHKAWDEDRRVRADVFPVLFSIEMEQAFFPKRKPVMDAFLSFEIQKHVLLFMKAIAEFRKQFEIVDRQ